jgi:peptidoglycan lytic transglycosylase
MILLVGFTMIADKEGKAEEPASKAETVNEENVTDNSIVDFVKKGIWTASWYGPRFNGKTTANGEVFNQMAYTAAHKSLKFGTLLRLTNTQNQKSIVVRINDRGPYIRGRQLDLSKAAALSLGIERRGVAKVKVEEISLKGLNFPVVSLN